MGLLFVILGFRISTTGHLYTYTAIDTSQQPSTAMYGCFESGLSLYSFDIVPLFLRRHVTGNAHFSSKQVRRNYLIDAESHIFIYSRCFQVIASCLILLLDIISINILLDSILIFYRDNTLMYIIYSLRSYTGRIPCHQTKILKCF